MVGLILVTVTGTTLSNLHAAEGLKRRVLVLPFDNILKNKNYQWMSDSIAENLKTELLKTGRFEVLDVTLLRKIDANIQFANLDAKNASGIAGRLNCEVAIVGRFSIKTAGGEQIVNFEADGVDALESKSVVIKQESAPVNAEIFDTVSKLAVSISDELNQKLQPLDASEFKRDNKLEKLIYRLGHPPVGFLDSIRVGNLRLQPAFDIDIFEYDVNLSYEEAAENKTIEFSYEYWGKRSRPHIASQGMHCNAEQCTVASENPVLTLAFDTKPDARKYRIRFHYPDARGPIIARYWATAGYPYMTSLSILGMSNPTALDQGSALPLGSMRGIANLELGLMPGRWQILPRQVRWAVVAQSFYGRGDFAQYDQANPATVSVQLFSVGGGLRFDRIWTWGKRYSMAPFFAVGLHYQKYFRDFSAHALNTISVNPEIGLSQYYRAQAKSPWYYVFTAAAGSFLYAGQNLAYFRVNIGIEYVIQ